jgi:hypothetical protein
MADVPHLMKNMMSSLEKNRMLISEDVVKSQGLPSCFAQMSHLESIVRLKENIKLRLVSGLSQKVIHPGQYGKMKVDCVTKVFTHSTAAASAT